MRHLRTIVRSCVGAVLLVGAGTGCTTNLGDFTLLASKNIDLEHFDSQKAENTTPVSGTDGGFFSVPNLKEATDRAEEAGHGNCLTNARIVLTNYVIKEEITVTGNPMKTGDAK